MSPPKGDTRTGACTNASACTPPPFGGVRYVSIGPASVESTHIRFEPWSNFLKGAELKLHRPSSSIGARIRSSNRTWQKLRAGICAISLNIRDMAGRWVLGY